MHALKTVREADCIVVGGGPGGLGAAVMAARNGCRTLLVEKNGLPGGMASMGEVQPFMPNCLAGKPLDGPVYLEWRERMERYLPEGLKERVASAGEDDLLRRTVGRDLAALAAEDLLMEAGVEVLYHHTLVDVARSGRRIDRIVLHGIDGFKAASAKVYVDSTGDAVLADLAGCACEYGDENGLCQPMTTGFKLSPVAAPESPEEYGAWRNAMQAAYARARREGTLDLPRENILYFHHYDPGVVHFNSTRILGHSALDGESLSKAEIEGRRQVRALAGFLRENVKGFEAAQIVSISSTVGVRESRRVVGMARSTREDFLRRRRYADGIARCNYPIDIHNPRGEGVELVYMPDTEYYEIPYGALVPRDCDNLLIGCRAICSDVAAHGSFRIMPTVCSIGQAAGMASALSVKTAKKPKDMPGIEVRNHLAINGAFL